MEGLLGTWKSFVGCFGTMKEFGDFQKPANEMGFSSPSGPLGPPLGRLTGIQSLSVPRQHRVSRQLTVASGSRADRRCGPPERTDHLRREPVT